MAGDNKDDPALDRVIDEAARRLTEGKPGAQFTAQVLARVKGTSRPLRSTWALAPLAAAAAIAIAIIVAWPFHSRHNGVTTETPPPAVERYENSRRPPVVEPPQALVQQGGPTVQRNRADAVDAEDFPTSDVDLLAPSAVAPAPVAALLSVAPPPLGIDSIGMPAIPPADSIAVPELAPVAPIDVTPIR